MSMFTAIALLHARVVFSQNNDFAMQDDELVAVSLLQADVVVKAKAARVEDHKALRVSFCSASEDVAGDTAGHVVAYDLDKAVHDSLDMELASLEVPAETQSKEDPGETAVCFMRALLSLMTCAVLLDGAWRWHCQSRSADLSRDVQTQPQRSPPLPDELSEAALAADLDRCKALLDAAEVSEAGDALEALVRADRWGSTAMHAAARSGSKAILELLLERRAQVDPVDSWDETPLHLAARQGHTDACALLVAKGASLRAINAQDCTPLVVAGQAGKDVVCNRLLDLGACTMSFPEDDLPPLITELLAKRTLPTDTSETE